MIARERICLTADKRHAVPADSTAATWLLAGVGCEIEEADARRYGIENGRLPADWSERLRAPVPPPAAPDSPEALDAAVPKGEVVGRKAEDPAGDKAEHAAPADKGLTLKRKR